MLVEGIVEDEEYLFQKLEISRRITETYSEVTPEQSEKSPNEHNVHGKQLMLQKNSSISKGGGLFKPGFLNKK